MPSPVRTIGVAVNVPHHDLSAALAKLKPHFDQIHSCLSPSPFPDEAFADTEFLFITGRGPPSNVTSLHQLPKLRHIQLASAGADKFLASPLVDELRREGGRGITIGTASGTHVVSIPNWVVGQLIAIYHSFPRMHDIARNERRWASGEVVAGGRQYIARSTLGRTAGMLGYGSLGRESARLLKAHGMRIVAANTSGKATPQTGVRAVYIWLRNLKCRIMPERYYSTKSPSEVKEFLSECDVLVASLPSTRHTTWFLDAEKLGWMKKDAVFLNVGRGTIIRSEELLKALDSPDHPLLGAAIDVTDPEPLPPDHPLWTHPKCIVTPHLSGDAEGEFSIATNIAIENARRLGTGETLLNLVDLERGY